MSDKDSSLCADEPFQDEPTLEIPKETMRDLVRRARVLCVRFDLCPSRGTCLDKCMYLELHKR